MSKTRFNRVLISAVAILSVFLCAVPGKAAENEGFDLENILITNRRAAAGLAGSTENIAVISRDEIRRLPVRNLSEVLRYVSGTAVPPGRGFGRSTSLSIQGADSRQVRVMIDGIPLNFQSSGQVNPSAFPIENIQRIEIIKGPSSSLWGSALGGVINVVTKDAPPAGSPGGSLTSSFAESRTNKESAELSGRSGEAAYYLFSSHMASGGKGSKDDVTEKKGFGKLSYDLNGMGKFSGSFGYSGAGVHSGVFPDGSWQSQPYRLRYGKASWEIDSEDADIKLELKHSRQELTTETFASVDDQAPASTVKTRDRLYQLSLNSVFHPRAEDMLVLGADFDDDTVKSNLYLPKAKSVQLQAPYANYTCKLKDWEINLGLRYDRNSEFGSQTSPSIGAVYHFEDASLKAAVSRAFNAPPLLWKFNDNTALGTAANPDIKPERGWVYELGLESRPLERLEFRFSLYRSDIRDAIARARKEPGLFFMKNFNKFRRQGGELGSKIHILDTLDFSLSGEFNHIENRLSGKVVKGGGKPRQRFNAGIEYKTKNGLEINLSSYYYFWNEPASSQARDRKTLYDLKVSKGFKHYRLFLNTYNLTNSSYWQDYFFPHPRRYFEGGFSIEW